MCLSCGGCGHYARDHGEDPKGKGKGEPWNNAWKGKGKSKDSYKGYFGKGPGKRQGFGKGGGKAKGLRSLNSTSEGQYATINEEDVVRENGTPGGSGAQGE